MRGVRIKMPEHIVNLLMRLIAMENCPVFPPFAWHQKCAHWPDFFDDNPFWVTRALLHRSVERLDMVRMCVMQKANVIPIMKPSFVGHRLS